MSSYSKPEELGNIFLTRDGEKLDWPTILSILHPSYTKMRPVRQEDLRKDYATYMSLTRAYLLSKGKVLSKEGYGCESVYSTITADDKVGAAKRVTEELVKESRAAERAQDIVIALQEEKALPSDNKMEKVIPILWKAHEIFLDTVKKESNKLKLTNGKKVRNNGVVLLKDNLG